MKRLIPLILAVILILPACTTQTGGENMASLYNYGGVVLQQIPVVEGYPYIVITSNNNNPYHYCYMGTNPAVYDRGVGITGGEASYKIPGPGGCRRYEAYKKGEWSLSYETTLEACSSAIPIYDEVIWANHDILQYSNYAIHTGMAWEVNPENEGVRFPKSPDPVYADVKLEICSPAGMQVPLETMTWKAADGYLDTVTIEGTPVYKVFDTYLTFEQLDAGTIGLGAGTETVETPLSGQIIQQADGCNVIGDFFAVSVSDEIAAVDGLTSGGIWLLADLTTEGIETISLAYAVSPIPTTNTTATANFSCKDLLYTDSVYRIKAWVHKTADGLDTTLPPTYTSAATFAGPTHSESHTFTGLTPGTEYEVYAVIWLETYGAASEHNATVTFTTLGGEGGLDFSNTELNIFDPNVTANSADFAVDWTGLPVTTANHVHYFISGELDDGTEAANSPVYLFSSDVAADGEHELIFQGLEPGTEYTVTARLLYNTTGDRSDFTDSGVEATFDFTTLADGGFDRNSFLLGLASGLGKTAAMKADADHNAWAQGYVVGKALWKML